MSLKKLTHEQFMELLQKEIKESGSQSNFAAKTSISPQYLTDILRNRRSPGPKLLGALGFREVKFYERTQEDEE